VGTLDMHIATSDSSAESAPSAPSTPGAPAEIEIAVELDALSLWYASRQALDTVTFGVPARRITALIGPSASGKSSLLRCLNRLNDEIPDSRVE